jgi:peptidoglycan/xylan/chitin deacetylase (PgdA/CDA1 family)
MIKRAAKTALRAAATVIGPHRWRRGPCLLVLTYHRVLPQEHPARAAEQPGMLVSPELLAMHFDVLQRHFTPVHIDHWLRASRAGEPPPGRSVAITFDDGWRDNYDYAFPVLKGANMPATIFLVTDMVGGSYRFWPNRLARALNAWTPACHDRLDDESRRRLATLQVPLNLTGTDITPDRIDAAISSCKSTDDASMHALLDRLEAALPEAAPHEELGGDRDLLNWNEVHTMADSGLVRFGSHTRRHTRLLHHLSNQVMADEIAGSRRSIEERLKQPVELFCYPNGDSSPEAYALVKAVYKGAVSTTRGWHRPRMDDYMIPRIGLHEAVSRTPMALLGRISGWPGL